MSDLQMVTQVVSVLQVGFAGWVAVFLLRNTTSAITDLVKQQAIIFQLLTEIKKDMDALWEHQRSASLSSGATSINSSESKSPTS